jgi:hypothetical protein
MMETLAYALFCGAIAGVIIWSAFFDRKETAKRDEAPKIDLKG